MYSVRCSGASAITPAASAPAERTKSPRRPGLSAAVDLDDGAGHINPSGLSRGVLLETEKDRLGDALDGIRPLSAAS